MKISDKSILKLVKLFKKHNLYYASENDLLSSLTYVLKNQKQKKLSPYMYINVDSRTVDKQLLDVESFLAALNPQWTMEEFVKNRSKFYELKISSMNYNQNIEEDNEIILNILEVLKSWAKKEK